MAYDANDGKEAALTESDTIRLVRAKLDELRKKLLDFTRRNPLIQVNFKPTSSAIIRIVDELPDVLRHNLTNDTAMRLVPLPALEEELADEQTDGFAEALFQARREDAIYSEEMEALDTSAADAAEQELNIERALKDRVREILGLPKRQTGENFSLSEHARTHGISPHYTLPLPEDQHEDGRHTDTDIQTLMLPEKLSRAAKSIQDRGRSHERETGVNVLHSVFGILEWKPPGERQKYESPLLLLEIELERRKSPAGARYFISGSDKVATNTTLAQKLLTEYGLELPDYEGGGVEAYFDQIHGLAPQGWTWEVRREVAVGIFPSTRIAMYNDLDPAKRLLAENETVARLLATTGHGAGEYAGDYNTDAPDVARRVPYLVSDADASQFSALVDVAEGGHVALEGPPGSGKSQTIVNMIAAALADGKKVIFVAEKLAALDVVKSPLEAVGLGEFVLPLQAGKASRERVYESLEERLQVISAGEHKKEAFAAQQRMLEQRRAKLQLYLYTLGKRLGATGMTVFEALGHAISTLEDRRDLPGGVRNMTLDDAETLSQDKREQIESDAKSFAEHLDRIEKLPDFWLATHAKVLNSEAAEDHAETARRIAENLKSLESEVRQSRLAPLVVGSVFKVDIATISQALKTAVGLAGKIDAKVLVPDSKLGQT